MLGKKNVAARKTVPGKLSIESLPTAILFLTIYQSFLGGRHIRKTFFKTWFIDSITIFTE